MSKNLKKAVVKPVKSAAQKTSPSSKKKKEKEKSVSPAPSDTKAPKEKLSKKAAPAGPKAKVPEGAAKNGKRPKAETVAAPTAMLAPL